LAKHARGGGEGDQRQFEGKRKAEKVDPRKRKAGKKEGKKAVVVVDDVDGKEVI
jgi:hypothetical protein